MVRQEIATTEKRLAKDSILTLLDGRGEGDLEVVRQEIATTEKRLATLRSLKNVLNVSINGPKVKQKKTKQSKPADDDDGPAAASPGDTRRLQIAKLVHAAGSIRVSQIAQKLNISPPPVYTIIAHPWFQKDAQGDVSLSPEGKKAVLAA